MRNFPGCDAYKKDTEIVLQENRSKITFLNTKRNKIRIITVDGCAINNSQDLRCDYALIPRNGVEIYVELKGSDILHAVKQIESTIILLSSNQNNMQRICIVVSTRVPRQTTSIQQLQSQFKKKFNASFRVKNIKDSYDLDKL